MDGAHFYVGWLWGGVLKMLVVAESLGGKA